MGIDKNYTIEDIRGQSVEKLYEVMASCGTPGYYQMAVEELQRRFLHEIASQTHSLTESSQRVEAIANELNGSVTAMDVSVQRLANSSDKMERLTRCLIWLTVALLLLTVFQVAMLLREPKEIIKSATPVTPSSPQKSPAVSAPTVVKPAAPAALSSPLQK